jgi:hypothetical protein
MRISFLAEHCSVDGKIFNRKIERAKTTLFYFNKEISEIRESHPFDGAVS